MLSNFQNKVKSFLEDNKIDLYVAVIIFLVGLVSFGLGRLSVLWPKKEPIMISNYEAGIRSKGTTTTIDSMDMHNSEFLIHNSSGKYVASKNGTAYHYPWCPGAMKIKEENKIWFNSKDKAEKAGYKPAGNCDGL